MNIHKGSPEIWFEIYVEDMKRATQFYETVLNIKLDQLSDPTDQSMEVRAFPGRRELIGSFGTLIKAKGQKVRGDNVPVYFECNDCAEEESRVEAAGGKVTRSKMPVGAYGFYTIVQDIEGNTIGLHSMK